MKMRQYVLGLTTLLLALPLLAAGIDGKWHASVDGGAAGPVELQFDLKAHGEKLTGTLTAPMRPATPISDGTVKGEDVTFTLAFPMMDGAPPLMIHYTGKLTGDELNLVSVFDMGQGPVRTTVAAKRAR